MIDTLSPGSKVVFRPRNDEDIEEGSLLDRMHGRKATVVQDTGSLVHVTPDQKGVIESDLIAASRYDLALIV